MATDHRTTIARATDGFLPWSGFIGRHCSGAEVIGRGSDVFALQTFLSGRWERPAAFVLEGDAGIGKTTLWNAALAIAPEQGLLVLSSRPAEAEQTWPYSGLGELFEPVLDRVCPALPLPRRRALMAALLLDESGEGSDPRTLCVAVRSALEVLAAESPVLVAVDDVQWLDSSFDAGAEIRVPASGR